MYVLDKVKEFNCESINGDLLGKTCTLYDLYDVLKSTSLEFIQYI